MRNKSPVPSGGYKQRHFLAFSPRLLRCIPGKHSQVLFVTNICSSENALLCWVSSLISVCLFCSNPRNKEPCVYKTYVILTPRLSASLVLEINLRSLFLQPASVGKAHLFRKQPLHSLLLLAGLRFTGDGAPSRPPAEGGLQSAGEEGFAPASPSASLILGHLRLPAVTSVPAPGRPPAPHLPLPSPGNEKMAFTGCQPPVPPWRSYLTTVFPTCAAV